VEPRCERVAIDRGTDWALYAWQPAPEREALVSGSGVDVPNAGLNEEQVATYAARRLNTILSTNANIRGGSR
jgi:hypothetical protein